MYLMSLPEIDEAMLSCISIVELKGCIGHSPPRIVVLLDELKAKRPVGTDEGHVWKFGTSWMGTSPGFVFKQCGLPMLT